MLRVLVTVAIALAPCVASARDIGPGSAAPGSATARLLAATRLAAGYDCRDVGCKKLRSCEEACYKLVVCGQQIRDRDKDGIPCENLCSRPCPR